MFVIVGAGLAGAKAAETLREEGYDGRVVLLGAEDERPYERPPLSKEYLRGEAERAAAYVHDAGFYAEHDIELRTGTAVTALDAGTGELELAGGERLSLRPPAAGHRRRAAAAAPPGRAASTASTCCGPSPTATRCARASTRAAGSWWSARAGSGRRSPPRRASAGWR